MEEDIELKLLDQPDCPHFTLDQLSIFDTLPSGVLVNVDNGKGGLKYAYSNPFLAHSLGYQHEEFKELLTKSCFAAIYEADRQKTINARAAVMSGKIVDSVSRQNKKDGSFVWILAHIRMIDLDGKQGMLFLFSKIENLIGLQDKLSEKNKEWSDILNTVPIGLLVFKEENGQRTTLSVNSSLIKFANSVGSLIDSRKRHWTEAELSMIWNQDIYSFCEYDDIQFVVKMLKDSEKEQVTKCTFRLRGSKNNPVYIYATCASKASGENSRTYYVTYQNVTEEEHRQRELIKQQEQLYTMSYYDALTGVKNRNAYNKLIESTAKDSLKNGGFVFCDINGLKKTNDSLGHYYGDKLIKYFAEILKETFETDNIYRLSGDEFLIIVPDTEGDSFLETMKYLTMRVDGEGSIASIGYIWKENTIDIQKRVTEAEQLMYVEKQKYYEEHKSIDSKHRPFMLNSLLKDFDENRFVMYLQPKISIDGTKVIGAEALARKIDADGTIMLPYTFVPQLEHEKLIPKLDFFMLEQTCNFLQKLHHNKNDNFCVSVNMSRVTIAENNFIMNVTKILDKYDFKRKNLEFELTESNKTLDSIRLEEYLVQLKDLGVKISLDDMGNDYSTLSLLTLDGFDWVKLDYSLVIKLNQKKARILIQHIIDTCHDLKLKVIAEGVETDKNRKLLMDMKCDAYQGFLKSQPVPASLFETKFLN